MKPTVAWPVRAKRPALMVGAVALVVAAGVAGAWLTRPLETAPAWVAKVSKARPAAVHESAPKAGPIAPIVVAEAEVPPEPSAADFARAAPPPAPPATAAAQSTEGVAPPTPADWEALAIDQLRAKANADEIPAMEELARRLVQGDGVTKDQQAGAGWLLRAAQHGSAQSAFNVGVMHERGFVVERDATKAIEWYRKAVAADLPMAKYNLALLLRDGKGAPRNGNEAVELLRSASRQGMAAAMFTLGDIYERGDADQKDPAVALAWFAIAAEFERQTGRNGDSALAKTALQRAQTLRRVLMPGELARAQQFSQSEFKQIVEALQPPKLPSSSAPPAEGPPAETGPAGATAAEAPVTDADPAGWPTAVNDQIRVIQQALIELGFLRDKPDGVIGPMTRASVRAFQRSLDQRETGEPTKEVFAALQEAIARRDAAGASKPEPRPEAKAEPAKTQPPAVANIDLGKPEPAPAPPVSADFAASVIKTEPTAEPPKPATAEAKPASEPKAETAQVDSMRMETVKVELPRVDPPKPPMPRIETAKPPMTPFAAVSGPPSLEPPKREPARPPATATIDLGRPEPPPAPPTSADIARADADAWPGTAADQIKAIQLLLREINFLRDAPDGMHGPATRTSILDYERAMGLPQTGEPSKALFDSLKETRRLTVPKAN